MQKTTFLLLVLSMLFTGLSCSTDRQLQITSPSGLLQVDVFTLADGQAAYTLKYKQELLLDTSALGFSFIDASEIKNGLQIKKTVTRSFSETWEMPWGEQSQVENHFNELRVTFRESQAPRRHFDLVFRVYDDGMGFRYEFPTQSGMSKMLIAEEHTQFNLTDDHTCWWLPGDWDISEHLYTESLFSAIDATSKREHPNLAQTKIPHNAVLTPLTMRTAQGLHLSFHEAQLLDYAGITLGIDPENLMMETILVGSDNTSWKVEKKLPFETPWRTLKVSESAAGLIESRLLENLCEPNKLGDVSWIKPAKYVGIWWEMHLDKSTWGMAGGRHGATTENAKRYISFAAANQIDAVLIEGWNTGWENWIGTADREGIFDFVSPYPDYDLDEVVRYANEKGVRIIMHHETSAAVTTYEQQLDTAYALMQHLGMDMVKTGYVGTIIPEGEYHHGQYMVNHYQRVIEHAARHRVAVNSHETIMFSGLRRTYPNMVSAENLRGQEFNAWASDGGNPPSHLPTVAFTRMLAGPIDYTPGIFNIKLNPYKPNNQVNTTLSHQLALYVVIYSPVQMAADLPEYYEGHPAMRFISDVAVDWSATRVLNGEVGRFVTIARKEKGSENWFLGAIANEDGHSMRIKTDFLSPDITYQAIVYADGDRAHWDLNPTAYTIEEIRVNHQSELQLKLAPGGGVAISFMPIL